jgi:hypothetical protein
LAHRTLDSFKTNQLPRLATKAFYGNGNHILNERGYRRWNGYALFIQKALFITFQFSTLFKFFCGYTVSRLTFNDVLVSEKSFCEIFKATFLNTLFCDMESGKQYFSTKSSANFSVDRKYLPYDKFKPSYFPNYFLWPKDPLSGSTAKLVDPGPNF